MTRLGFFLFNLGQIVALYGLMYVSGARHDAFRFAVNFISLPTIVISLVLAIFAIVRWFMHQDADVLKEGLTLLNACWMVALATGIALWLTGGAPHGLPDILHMIW